jgi:hypothetical protein
MNFTPKTENEVKNTLSEGIYDVEVMVATDKLSKAGNDMIEMKLGIWEGEKIRCYLFDYLIEVMPAKLRHACDAFGILDKYQSGQLNATAFEGRTGKAKIGIQKSTDDAYPDKNVVKDYVCRKAPSIKGDVKNEEIPPHTDDDLPF